ncbi:MAG TPA: polysaccharide deacetylase family protein [Niastella sp.]
MQLIVLMYHKVQPVDLPDPLTISVRKFSAQLQYLVNHGFNFISLSELKEHITSNAPLPPKAVMITFDDGYRDNLLYAYPVLIKYNVKAGIFLIGEKVRFFQEDEDNYLNRCELQLMSSTLVEYGFHGYKHSDYAAMSFNEIEEDLISMQNRFKLLGVKCEPCFAYPYGSFHRKNCVKQLVLEAILENFQILFAFRIGNRINKLPLKNNYLINRIDVTGNEPLWKFKLMCRFGKKWLP